MLKCAEAIANMIYNRFCLVFGSFIADALPRKIVNLLQYLLQTYLAPEFWRL